LLVLALAQGIAALLQWPVWAGYALLGVVLAIAGYALFTGAQAQLKAVRPLPEQTVETMKENAEWIKERTTSDKT